MNIKTYSWQAYNELMIAILNHSTPPPPYDQAAYLDYLGLNHARQKRWFKTAKIQKGLIEKIKQINQPQQWILITEPWCGDAAHSNPFIVLLAGLNSLIDLKIVLRDESPVLIENYLTNGGKAIPILIIRDEANNDLAVWGPRPAPCQKIFLELKRSKASFDEQKVTLQNWYNQDRGQTLQQEILELISKIVSAQKEA
jgi:hypothetical protein